MREENNRSISASDLRNAYNNYETRCIGRLLYGERHFAFVKGQLGSFFNHYVLINTHYFFIYVCKVKSETKTYITDAHLILTVQSNNNDYVNLATEKLFIHRNIFIT